VVAKSDFPHCLQCGVTNVQYELCAETMNYGYRLIQRVETAHTV
jgi:hypothetical protein